MLLGIPDTRSEDGKTGPEGLGPPPSTFAATRTERGRGEDDDGEMDRDELSEDPGLLYWVYLLPTPPTTLLTTDEVGVCEGLPGRETFVDPMGMQRTVGRSTGNPRP